MQDAIMVLLAVSLNSLTVNYYPELQTSLCSDYMLADLSRQFFKLHKPTQLFSNGLAQSQFS
jgi:hypothetical protein